MRTLHHPLLNPFVTPLSLGAVAVVVAAMTGCSFSPVDAFTGGHVGTLQTEGVAETSLQSGVDAPIANRTTSDIVAETSARLGIDRSGSDDALINGLLAAVVAPLKLEGAACSLPVVFREGNLVLDEAWPCDSTNAYEFTNGIYTRGTITQEVSVIDLVIEPGRGDNSIEAEGTIEIDSTQEFHSENQILRSFFVSELSFSFSGRNAARE